MSSELGHIDPILEDYTAQMTRLPRTGDACRHVVILQHKTRPDEVYQEVIHHPNTGQTSCFEEYTLALMRLAKKIHHARGPQQTVSELSGILEDLL